MSDPAVPAWLLWGLVLGGGFAVVVLGVFLAGERLFPADGSRAGRTGTGEGVQTRRRDEIREYLETIGEPYEEDREVEGYAVDFFRPDRDVAVTFDAKAFLNLRDSAVYPVLCEHEMPGVHLGARLPFETPTVETGGPEGPGDAGDGVGADDGPRWADGAFADERDRWRARQAYWDGDGGDRAGAAIGDGGPAGPGPDRVEESYAALGLTPDADGEAVRAAYRERVKDVHPDHGGDREAFRRIQDAYATAREHAE